MKPLERMRMFWEACEGEFRNISFFIKNNKIDLGDEAKEARKKLLYASSFSFIFMLVEPSKGRPGEVNLFGMHVEHDRLSSVMFVLLSYFLCHFLYQLWREIQKFGENKANHIGTISFMENFIQRNRCLIGNADIRLQSCWTSAQEWKTKARVTDDDIKKNISLPLGIAREVFKQNGPEASQKIIDQAISSVEERAKSLVESMDVFSVGIERNLHDLNQEIKKLPHMWRGFIVCCSIIFFVEKLKIFAFFVSEWLFQVGAPLFFP